MSDTATEEAVSGWVLEDPSETQVSVHRRMLAILEELPAIGKTQRNQSQGFMYRGHDDVMAALNPLLAKYGVFITSKVLERVPSVRATSQGKALYEVSLCLRFTFHGADGDSVVCETWGEGTDSGDKATSKAHTMAFKSALAIAFSISTHELSDADASSPEDTYVQGRSGGAQTASPAPRPAAPAQTFDPGVHLLEGALEGGDNFVAELGAVLHEIDPAIDWKHTLAPAFSDHFGVEGREELDAARTREYWIRMANLARKLQLAATPGTIPAVEDDKIEEAVRWAFATRVPVPVIPKEQPTRPEDAELAERLRQEEELARQAQEAAERDSASEQATPESPPDTSGSAS